MKLKLYSFNGFIFLQHNISYVENGAEMSYDMGIKFNIVYG